MRIVVRETPNNGMMTHPHGSATKQGGYERIGTKIGVGSSSRRRATRPMGQSFLLVGLRTSSNGVLFPSSEVAFSKQSNAPCQFKHFVPYHTTEESNAANQLVELFLPKGNTKNNILVILEAYILSFEAKPYYTGTSNNQATLPST